MGKLLSLLARDESTCCTPQKYDVFLDFESKFDEYTRADTFLTNRDPLPVQFLPRPFESFSRSNDCSIYRSVGTRRVAFVKGYTITWRVIAVFIEFLDAQPSDIERETFEAVQRVLKNSESILEEIQCYKGAGKEIREAISAPTEECQRKAYLTVAPLVAKLKRFYEFSLELGECRLHSFFCFISFPPRDEYF